MHPLLTQQLRQLGLGPGIPPTSSTAWQQFLDCVDRRYIGADEELELLKQSIASSSKDMQDLNEQLRRTSESQLTEERDKLHTVLRSIGDGLCVVDHNWNILLLNPQGQRLCAHTEAEVVGRPLPAIMSLSSGTSLTEPIFTQILLEETAQGDTFRTDDGLLTTAAGHSIPVSYVLAPIVRENRVGGAVLVFRDISDRKHTDDIRHHTENMLRRHQAALLELTRNTVIQSGLLEQALHEITRATATTLGVSRVSIWFLNEDYSVLRCKDLYELPHERHSSGAELQAKAFPNYFRELRSHRIIDAADAKADPRTAEFTTSYLIPLGISAMLDIPIRYQGKLVGVLCHEHVGQPRPWTLEEQQFGHAIGSLVSLALEAAERLHAEQALRKSEARTRLVIDTAISAVIGMDDKGIIIDWNAQAEQTFGWKRHEALGQEMANLIIPAVHRECHRRGLERFLETGAGPILNKRIEVTALHRNGAEFPIELAITPLKLENAYTFTAFVVDITERKRAEEALRTSEERLAMTVQSSHIGIWDWNIATNSVYLSPQWKAQLGYDDASLANDYQEWATRIHADDRRHVEETLQSCLSGAQQQFEYEHRLRHRDDSFRWILSRGGVLRNADGVASRMVGIHIDTTDRKRGEEELRAAKEVAEAASKSKSEFLANMSHEIRTPMNGVLGTTELLLNSDLTDKQRHLASTVHRSGRTLLAIINDILDFSKIEAGKLEMESVGFDLSQVLSESLELFMEAARRKGLRLTQHTAEGVPLCLKGDPVRFRQVLMNLLSNAVKFTDSGTVSLTTELVESTPHQVLLRLSVTDSGIGIAPAARSRIFDAFSQADGSTTRRYGGTGLGLSIAKQLVLLMGGAITVESTPGSGSTFSFTAWLDRQPLGESFPTGLTTHVLFPPPYSAGEQTANPTDSPSCFSSKKVEEIPSSAGRILLAEDSPVNREVAVGMLESLGYQVTVAENGQQALLVANNDRIDMVLMDCQMPEMDGLTATIKIRQREVGVGRRRLPIIALTAHAMQGDRDQCLAAGMDDYLTKPYSRMQLRDMVIKWLPKKTPGEADPMIAIAQSPETARPDRAHLAAIARGDDSLENTAVNLKVLADIRALQGPNRPNVLAAILRKYLDSSRSSVDALHDAVRANNPAALQAIAHRLRSSSAQLGAVAVAARCQELETMGKRKNLIDADHTLAQLQTDYLIACTIFRNEIAKGTRP